MLQLYLERKVLVPEKTGKFGFLVFSSEENASFILIFNYSMVAQTVKNPPATWETWVRSLGWEDPLQEGMASHGSTLAWRIPWTEGPGRQQEVESHYYYN